MEQASNDRADSGLHGRIMANCLKEADIRPERMRKEYWGLLEKEVEKYCDDQKRIKKEFTQEIKCPLCGSNRSRELFIKRGFTFVRCHECNLVYVNPIFKGDKIKEFYNSHAMNYMQNLILKRTAAARKAQIHAPRAEMIKSFVPQGKLLEIGCSVGYFLEAAQEIGDWELYGVEPNKTAAEYVRKRMNIEVYSDLVENVTLTKDCFDVIASFEVIEHIANPFDVIKSCYRILKKQGYLFISTPNIEGFDFRILGKHHRSYSAPGHLVYFTPATFRHMLDKAGFAEIQINTPGALDVENIRNEILRNPSLDIEIDEFLAELLLQDDDRHEKARFEFQRFLANNGFSSHMIAICKK